MISLSIDLAVNAAYIALSENAVARTIEVSDAVLVDLDAMGVVRGIEVLDLDAELPLQRLTQDWHVHSRAINALMTIRPSVGMFAGLTQASVGAIPANAAMGRVHSNA